MDRIGRESVGVGTKCHLVIPCTLICVLSASVHVLLILHIFKLYVYVAV